MENIFVRGDFKKYRPDNLELSMLLVESRKIDYSLNKKTVFISHKHGELEDLADVIGFFEKEYGVKTYIDSRDKTMPEVPNGETAIRIKNKIETCSKFILLATDAAIQSKWCNWELGYGDAQKYKKGNIALLPMKEHNTSYSGNEYLTIYPHIIKRQRFYYGGLTKTEYYVQSKNEYGTYDTIELKDWLNK